MGIAANRPPEIIEFIAIRSIPVRMRTSTVGRGDDEFMTAVRDGEIVRARQSTQATRGRGKLDARRVLDAIANAAGGLR